MPDLADARGRRMGRLLKLPGACWPETPVAELPGVGPARAQRFARLSIVSVADLLLHLPRRYEDTRQLVPLGELRPGGHQTSRARVRDVRARHSPQRRMALVEATLEERAAAWSAPSGSTSPSSPGSSAPGWRCW